MIDLNGGSQEHENSGVSADSCNHPAVEDPLHETRQVISFPPNLPCETLIFEGLFWARWNPVIATSLRLEEKKLTAEPPLQRNNLRQKLKRVSLNFYFKLAAIDIVPQITGSTWWRRQITTTTLTTTPTIWSRTQETLSSLAKGIPDVAIGSSNQD